MRRDILDCTLRDGGYVNDWEFDTETASAIIDGLYSAGVRWIEVGIMGKNSKVGRQTKFSDFKEIKPYLKNRYQDCHYAVMVTTSSSDSFVFPECSPETPDVIRIAYFKPETEKTFAVARSLIKKGYIVFMQSMATFMYTDKELIDLVKAINDLHPYAFYMVDSFSTMYPADVEKMRDSILLVLDKKILFGFHAHNNIQMAFANVQEFMKGHEDRGMLIDGSIYGMGRGAGNVPLELLMKYLNDNYQQDFNVSVVLDLYEKYLKDIYKEYRWGYTLPYYLTAVNYVNSAWGWYFLNRGIDSLPDLEKAVKMIPNEWYYTLKPEIGEEIIHKITGG